MPRKSAPKTLHQRRLSPVKSFRLKEPTHPSEPRTLADTGTPPRLGEGTGEGPKGTGEGPHCGGPRTPAGKAVSARNSTTHGIFSRQTVLPHLGEDPEGYHILMKTLIEQWRPHNLVEEQYLELWAEASWKLRRLSRLEAQLWEQEDRTPAERLADLDKLGRLHARLCRQMDKSVRMLGADVPDLLRRRIREDVLLKEGITDTQCRQNPGFGAIIERKTREKSRAVVIPDLEPCRLDNTEWEQDPAKAKQAKGKQPDNKKCENELPPVPPSSVSPVPAAVELSYTPHSLPEQPSCAPRSLFDTGAPSPLRGGEDDGLPSAGEGPDTEKGPKRCPSPATDYRTYRKWEQDLFNRHTPESKRDTLDWDTEEMQETYA